MTWNPQSAKRTRTPPNKHKAEQLIRVDHAERDEGSHYSILSTFRDLQPWSHSLPCFYSKMAFTCPFNTSNIALEDFDCKLLLSNYNCSCPALTTDQDISGLGVSRDALTVEMWINDLFFLGCHSICLLGYPDSFRLVCLLHHRTLGQSRKFLPRSTKIQYRNDAKAPSTILGP